ncbi:MAG: hypothetical protein EHM91_06600 [Planctomycetota bacterium]|nr:MAG: hypothetical protein EHM91_06600 [Planctomycetota bacterium]
MAEYKIEAGAEAPEGYRPCTELLRQTLARTLALSEQLARVLRMLATVEEIICPLGRDLQALLETVEMRKALDGGPAVPGGTPLDMGTANTSRSVPLPPGGVPESEWRVLELLRSAEKLEATLRELETEREKPFYRLSKTHAARVVLYPDNELTTAEIYDAMRRRGYRFYGKRPASNLSAALTTSRFFRRTEDGKWALRDPEEEWRGAPSEAALSDGQK